MRRMGCRMGLSVGLVGLLAVLVPGTAVAAGPTFRDRGTFSEVDTDFCGTGQTVLIDGNVVANGWIGTTGATRNSFSSSRSLCVSRTRTRPTGRR
jgi:hypothetical protein